MSAPPEGGDDLGVIEHPAPNVEAGDVVVLAYVREAIVTARVETQPRDPIHALLEVAAGSDMRIDERELEAGGGLKEGASFRALALLPNCERERASL